MKIGTLDLADIWLGVAIWDTYPFLVEYWFQFFDIFKSVRMNGVEEITDKAERLEAYKKLDIDPVVDYRVYKTGGCIFSTLLP